MAAFLCYVSTLFTFRIVRPCLGIIVANLDILYVGRYLGTYSR